MPKLPALLFTASFLLTSTASWTHEGHEYRALRGKRPGAMDSVARETAKALAPGGSPAALSLLHAQMDSIDKDLATEKLGDFPLRLGAIQAAAKILASDTSLTREKREMSKVSANRIANWNRIMGQNVESGKIPAASRNADRIKAQIEMLDRLFKK